MNNKLSNLYPYDIDEIDKIYSMYIFGMFVLGV